MPPKGSKQLNEKRKQIGQLASKTKKVATLKESLGELDREINTLEHRLSRKRSRVAEMHEALSSIGDPKTVVPFPILSVNAAKRRKKNQTNEQLSLRSRQRRRDETFVPVKAIHGSSKDNQFSALDGMIDTMTTKYPVSVVSTKIMNSKPAIRRHIEQKFHKNLKKNYYHSTKNQMRSLNVYYSHNVSGKRKYISLRKSNKSPDMANYIPYKDLAKLINEVNIGTLHSVNPSLTQNLPSEEIGDGVFRDLKTYAMRLAEFYLKVNCHRKDKLKTFEKFQKKDASSVLLLTCIGGDEAPSAGTSFLISFLNVAKRVASSFENFLLFGANVKENGAVVRRYLKLLMEDIKFLESDVFSVKVMDKTYKIEFKMHGLPNDMKMLAFLGGELSNASLYFTTFANVSQRDSTDIKKKFSMNGKESWKPFNYSDRLKDASKVSKKKIELQKKNVQETTRRNLLTKYISTELKSRQEEVPLVGEYIDLARCEPLHLKNNCTKELFMKVLDIVISQAALPSSVKNFKDVLETNIFHKFIMFIKTDMNSNFLAKKLIAWFNENKESNKERPFGFRFRGKESANYLKGFPFLIEMIMKLITSQPTIKRLCQIFHQSLLLRKLVSFSVRIEDIDFDISEMLKAGRKLFLSNALHESSISPSMLCFSVIAPAHCADTIEQLDLGLGVYTMEGREQKHQQIKKYAHNTTVQQRWPYIFRHEFIQLIHLREHGFDQKRYRKRIAKYLPVSSKELCNCSLKLKNGKCFICDSSNMMAIEDKIRKNLSS